MIFAKHILQWSIPTVLETLAKSGLVAFAAYLLPKEDFGIYTLAMLLYSYHPFLQLGVVEGLILKLPGYYVKNDINRIITSLGLSLSYSITILILLILSGLIFVILNLEYERLYLLCGIYFLSSIPYQIYNHYILLNRYTYSFNITLYIRLINASLRCFLQFPLLVYFGIYGLVVGEFLIYLVSTSIIMRISRLHVHLNININKLKKYISFGFPVWVISIMTMFSVSFEKGFSAYFFDIKTIADVGLLAFMGSIFMQINGQILSLFTQYAREFFVHSKRLESLVTAFIIFSLVCAIIYVLIAAIFYGLLTAFFIPNFLPGYSGIVEYLPVIYCVFLIRALISNFVSFFLVVNNRIAIIYAHTVFFSVVLFALFFINLTFGLNLLYLLFSILAGLLLELIFMVIKLSSILKSSIYPYIIAFIACVNSIVTIYLYFDENVAWTTIGLSNLLIIFLAFLMFAPSNKFKVPLNIFLSILRKDYLDN